MSIGCGCSNDLFVFSSSRTTGTSTTSTFRISVWPVRVASRRRCLPSGQSAGTAILTSMRFGSGFFSGLPSASFLSPSLISRGFASTTVSPLSMFSSS